MAKRNSASNVAERPVVGGRGRAMVTGAAGHALAAVFIAAIEGLANAQDSVLGSRKDRLSKLCELAQADVVAFHADMMNRAQAVNTAMLEAQKQDAAITGLREYFDRFPGQQTLYVETSMWKKMALAVDAGWKPDMSKGWADISASATAHVNAIGATSADPANPQPVGSATKRKPAGRAKSTPQAKAVSAVKSALKGEDGKALPKNNRNLAQVVEGVLADATLEELTEVSAVVQKLLTAAQQAQDELRKIAAKGKAKPEHPEVETDKPGVTTQTTSKGATVVRSAAVPSTPKREHAEATLTERGNAIIRATPAGRAKAKA